MNGINYIAAKHVVVLPNKRNPKVYLAIDSAEIAKLSFKLYNPFSVKGKVLKNITRFICIYLNSIAKIILATVKISKNDFSTYIEKELKENLLSSVYCATAKDKVVLQLISNNQIFGYLKLAQNQHGITRLMNERSAIIKLSSLEIVPELRYSGDYNNHPYIVLENLEGIIGDVDKEEYGDILSKFKKPIKYKLKNHPRVESIIDQLVKNDLKDLAINLQKEIFTCDTYFYEVYEHGDFAPWNLIRTDEGLVPFDFEYFVDIGLEFMDEIKYYFQISSLLKGLSGRALIDAIIDAIRVDEIRFLIHIFLLKEIVLKTNDGDTCNFEKQLLLILLDEKA